MVYVQVIKNLGHLKYLLLQRACSLLLTLPLEYIRLNVLVAMSMASGCLKGVLATSRHKTLVPALGSAALVCICICVILHPSHVFDTEKNIWQRGSL